MRGIIALDIDGTITSKMDHLPISVGQFLKQLHDEGWEIFFITGRTFFWSFSLLKELSFHYSIGCLNGALIIEIPERKILHKQYLTKNELSEICKISALPCVVYSGYEEGEKCFYCPQEFGEDELSYLKSRTKRVQETWVPLDNFSELPILDFPSVRIFMKEGSQEEISFALENKLNLHAPSMLDSFDNSRRIVQITAQDASKGNALKQYLAKIPHKNLPVIAAGDDMNDIPMLKFADIKVVMETASQEVLKLADVIAPSAEKCGIIEGLKTAILKLK